MPAEDGTSIDGLEFILFDLYETLVGCEAAPIEAACDAMAARIGVSTEALEVAERLTMPDRMVGHFGDDLEDELAEILRRADVYPDRRLVEEFRECLLEAWREAGRVYEDVIPSLRRLRDHGKRLALVSNCSRLTRPLLDDWELKDCFDAVILSCDVGRRKPDHAILKRALKEIGGTTTSSMLVDDNESYVRSARDLGLRGRRIDRTRVARSHGSGVIGDLWELTALLLDDRPTDTRTGSDAPRD